MNRHTTPLVRFTVAVVLGLILVPAGSPLSAAEPDACAILFCPWGTDNVLCTKELKESITVCRKIDAVDKGIEATNETLDAVNNAYTTVNTEFLGLKSELERIQAGMTSVSDTSLFLEQFISAIETFSPETLTMSQNLLSSIEEGRQLIDKTLELERDRYIAFVGPGGCGSECWQFRGELLGLVNDLELIFNKAILILVAQMPEDQRHALVALPRIDLSAMKQLIQNPDVPGVLFFPLHEAIDVMTVATASTSLAVNPSALSPGNSLIAILSEYLLMVKESLEAVLETTGQIFNAGSASARYSVAGTSPDWVNDVATRICVDLARQSPESNVKMMTALTILDVVGKLIFEVGDVLEAQGFTEFDAEGAVAFGVLVSAAVEARPERAFGKFLKSGSTFLGVITGTMLNRIESCRNVIDQQVTLCILERNMPKMFDECRQAVLDGERFGF